ncbi:Carboxylesterase 5A [Halocaridina rubra]|uniref:Carboxylic ester hydrolase n=1 Tax=Halocaridina rubra TaxID=373956 RepID=A0AAN8XMN2_HALRR
MGVQMYEYGVDYLAFLSIPYAKPPVDALRFKNPEASEPWLGDLNATVLPHNCVQFILAGREDCLYLNVYTPLNALNASSPLPVLVWIHGGGYYMGGSSDNHNFEPLLQRDVIVVMIQYRLGVLGFMSTEDDAAPGNLGLKDQTLAMQWVYDNIAAFGGDTSRITIFGASAGAASVHYQLVAPSAAGLFSGAVMISGNAFGPWASGRDFLWAAQEIAINFGCPTSPSDDLITCLQGVNEHELDAMYLHFAQWNLQPFYFAPRVDGVYIPEEPATLMKEGRYSHVPTLMGINRDEMALESVEWYAVPGLLENLAANFTVLGPITLELYNDEDPVNTATAVYDYYNGGTNFSKENCDNLTKMLSDGFFAIRHDWLAELMVEQDSVYLYELHHRGEHGYTNIYLENGLDLPQAANYISHSDQSQYLFNPKFSELQTPEDRAVGNIFVDTWTNFAKTGNPTSDGSLGFTWEVSSAPDLRHLKIIPNPLMEGDSRSSERVFWNSLPLRINNLLKP